MSEKSQKQKNWFARHKFITALVVLFIFADITGHYSGTPQDAQQINAQTAPSSDSSIQPTSQASNLPKYEILDQSRPDYKFNQWFDVYTQSKNIDEITALNDSLYKKYFDSNRPLQIRYFDNKQIYQSNFDDLIAAADQIPVEKKAHDIALHFTYQFGVNSDGGELLKNNGSEWVTVKKYWRGYFYLVTCTR